MLYLVNDGGRVPQCYDIMSWDDDDDDDDDDDGNHGLIMA